MSGNSVDLPYQRERILWVNDIPPAPTPTRIILQKNGTFTGVLQNGLAVSNTAQLQDVNPTNAIGSNGFPATYQHNFTTIGTKLLFDLTDGSVYDLSAYTNQTLIIVWPASF